LRLVVRQFPIRIFGLKVTMIVTRLPLCVLPGEDW